MSIMLTGGGFWDCLAASVECVVEGIPGLGDSLEKCLRAGLGVSHCCLTNSSLSLLPLSENQRWIWWW